MDKALRTSAWSVRPLTPAQVRYAGLDALVLTWCFKLGMQVRREEKVLFFFFFPLKKYLSSSKL